MEKSDLKSPYEILAFSRSIDGQGTQDHQNCTYTSAELRVLVEQTLVLPQNSRVVEIGVFTGRSTSVYFQLQADLNLDIHLFDNWSWNPKLAAHAFTDLVLDHFNEVPFTLHKMRSDYPRPWNKPIDLLHIDGWHDMPGIDGDCRQWLPLVKRSGVVVFHDSQSPDVAKCIKEYVQQDYWVKIAEAERTTAWRKP